MDTDVEFEIRRTIAGGFIIEAQRPGLSGEVLPVAPGIAIPMKHTQFAAFGRTIEEAWARLQWRKI